MDVEYGLGNVTSEIMLATLLNYWVKYYGKPDIVRTDPEGAFRDQGFRRGLAAKSIRLDIDPGNASWKNMSSWENPLIQPNSQQFVWLEGLLTVSRFKKSLMNALPLTVTYIETEDSLRGSCCWERHRPTRQLAKILIWLSAVSKWWTKLRNNVSVSRKSRIRRAWRRNCHFENVAKKFIKPDLGGIGQQVNGAGIGNLANTRVRE